MSDSSIFFLTNLYLIYRYFTVKRSNVTKLHDLSNIRGKVFGIEIYYAHDLPCLKNNIHLDALF